MTLLLPLADRPSRFTLEERTLPPVAEVLPLERTLEPLLLLETVAELRVLLLLEEERTLEPLLLPETAEELRELLLEAELREELLLVAEERLLELLLLERFC